jgi:hypothetical protein
VFVPAWSPPDRFAYAYLLGVYLGDGCLFVRPGSRGAQLVVACDATYPSLIEEAWAAIVLTSLHGSVSRVRPREQQCVRLQSAWNGWPAAFPQHGPGRKHERLIALEPWQQAIVDEHPWEFLRGLLHSDGCRTVNRFKTKLPSGRMAEYAYPRWFFSNRSDDIRRMFCDTCDALGVRWTQSNPRNISVSHRRSVALLDEWVGPKA